MPNILFSTTRMWNCGDDFILFGVCDLVESILPQCNFLIYNRNPELHSTRVHYDRVTVRRPNHAEPVTVNLAQALKGIVGRFDNSWRPGFDLSNVHRCIFAGTPEWAGQMVAPLVEALLKTDLPVAYLGLGTFEKRQHLRFEGLPEEDRILLGRAQLVTARDDATLGLLAPVGAELLPCPALFAAPKAHRRKGPERIALCMQGAEASNPQKTGRDTHDYCAALFRALAERYDCTLVCHYIDEVAELDSLFEGRIPIRFSYDPRDYAAFYESCDLTVTTRVHGAGLCAALGVPAIVIAHSARSATAKGFLSELIDIERTSVSAATEIISTFPVERRSRQIIAHKAAAKRRYLALLEPFLTEPTARVGSATFSLAVRHYRSGEMDQAAAAFDRVLRATPEHAESLHYRGLIAAARGQFEESAALLRRAIEAAPEQAAIRSSLGRVLRHSGDFAAAVDASRSAVEAAPDDPDILNELGISLLKLGETDAAIAALRRVIRIAPESPEAHTNLGQAHLQAGDFEEGWPEYAWHYQSARHRENQRVAAKPLWDGSALRGRRLLVHAEQGYGDTIQFARFAGMIGADGERVVLECERPLARLMESLEGIERVIPAGTRLPDFDLQCPLMRLPLVLGTTLDGLVNKVPYLRPPTDAVARAAARIEQGHGLRVGLAWAGSPAFAGDNLRSPGFDAVAPLLELDGIRFFGLQHDPGRRQADGHPAADKMTRFDPGDFAQTAALMMAMDLIIASDSAPLHLAGALGRPVWGLLGFAPDWRWLRDRSDSPWYPTMRLYRQPQSGDWPEVVGQVASELQACAADDQSQLLPRRHSPYSPLA